MTLLEGGMPRPLARWVNDACASMPHVPDESFKRAWTSGRASRRSAAFQRIIGQEEAIVAISKAVRRARS